MTDSEKLDLILSKIENQELIYLKKKWRRLKIR